MCATAIGELAPDAFDREAQFVFEAHLRIDERPVRMSAPGMDDGFVHARGFLQTLDPRRIAVVVRARVCRGAEMDDRRVACALLFARRSKRGKETGFLALPIGKTVDRAAIAEDDTVMTLRERQLLELALSEEDHALHCAACAIAIVTWKPSTKKDACHLGKDCDVLAQDIPQHLEHGRLSSAWSAGESDELSAVGCDGARAWRFPARNHFFRDCARRAISFADSTSVDLMSMRKAPPVDSTTPLAPFTDNGQLAISGIANPIDALRAT